jgi:hypothetical protein
MEVLFFIIFGGLLLFFIGYGVWMHKQDKKIIDEYNKQAGEHVSDQLTHDDGTCFMFGERPWLENYN